jgi:hypothetical protein
MASDLIGIKFRSEGKWLVHPELRDRLIEDARDKGTNLGDLTVMILCAHFRVEYTGTARKSNPRAEPVDQFNFRCPPELERVIAATYPRRKAADGIRHVLCAHYGLGVPPKVRQTRRRPARPAAA